MLVHSHKVKPPRYIPMKHSSFNEKRDKHCATNKDFRGREDTTNANQDSDHVNKITKKLNNMVVGRDEEFSRTQRSETVLQIITSALNSGGSIILSPLSENIQNNAEIIEDGIAVKRAESNIASQLAQIQKDKLKKTALPKPNQIHQQLQQSIREIKQCKNNIVSLQKDNSTLKNHLAFVYSQISASMSNDSVSKPVEQKQIKLERKIKLQKRYQEAVLKYQLEIYQQRCEETKREAASYLQRIFALENLLIDLKIENCSTSTAVENLRLQVEALQNHYISMANYFNAGLSNRVENTFGDFHTRLEKAFENLHKLKCVNTKKKFGLFKKK